MKLNLLLDNEKGQLNGYTNIDQFTPSEKPPEDTRITGDIYPLDWICDNGECSELIARCILCYFPLAETGIILTNWMNKIKVGGLIVIEEMDVELVSWALVNKQITPKQYQKLVYGEQTKKWDIKKSGLTISAIIDFLEGSGFKIITKRLNNMKFNVTAKRV